MRVSIFSSPGFFFIGAILFSSALYIGYAFKATGFILIQAVLVLMAATSLIATGLIMAANMRDAARRAKRAVMLFGILIIANFVFFHAIVKTTSGGVLVMTFGITGILTGMILMKALEQRSQGDNGTFTGGLHNA